MTAILRGHLVRRLDLCSPDELRVIDRLVSRIELGRERYGDLNFRLPESRDWRREFGEELLDAIIYDTIEQIQAENTANDEERRRALLVSAGEDERAELARWQSDDQRTRVSEVSQVIASTPEAVPEPVVEWEAGEGPRSTRGRK